MKIIQFDGFDKNKPQVKEINVLCKKEKASNLFTYEEIKEILKKNYK